MDHLRDMRSFVKEVGGVVVREVPENKTSASKRQPYKLPDGTTGYRVIRPKFEQILTDLRRGEANALAVPDIDRMTRDPRTLEEVIDLVEYYGILVVSRTGNIDLTTDAGIASARSEVSQRNAESRNTSRRVTNGMRHLAQDGRVSGGRYRPFGWRKDRTHINKREAKHIRDQLDRIIAGKVSPITIAKEWQQRGIPTVSGKSWRDQTVRDMFLNPRLCGWKTYHGEIVRDENGDPVIGRWEAIITPEQHAGIVAVWGKTGKPGTRLNGRGRGNRTKYLLSPFVRCGKCNAKMNGHVQRHRSGKVYVRYQCPPKGQGGCGGVSRDAQKVDEYIRALVIADQKRINAYAPASDKPWPKEEELRAARRRIKELTNQWKKGGISGGRYFPLLEELEAEEKELERERDKYAAQRQEQRNMIADLASEWDNPTFSIEQKQQAVSKSLVAIIIKPAGRRPFHPDQIEPVFTQLPESP